MPDARGTISAGRSPTAGIPALANRPVVLNSCILSNSNDAPGAFVLPRARGRAESAGPGVESWLGCRQDPVAQPEDSSRVLRDTAPGGETAGTPRVAMSG